MPPQRFYGCRCKRHLPSTTVCFWFAENHAIFPAIYGGSHLQSRLFKVDVLPPKRQQFALPHACRKGEGVQRLKTITSNGDKERSRLLRRKGPHFGVCHARPIGERNNVSGHINPTPRPP